MICIGLKFEKVCACSKNNIYKQKAATIKI